VCSSDLFFAALLIAEAMLQVFNAVLHARGSTIAHPAERSMWMMKPSEHHRLVYDAQWVPSERNATVNELGFRGPSLTPKPEDTVRVLITGDSTVFGFPAPDRWTWAAFLDSRLEETAAIPVEIVNFGIIASTSHGNLLDLRKYGGLVEPDVLVVAIGAWNDYQLSAQADAIDRHSQRYERQVKRSRALRGVMLYQLVRRGYWHFHSLADRAERNEFREQGLFEPNAPGAFRRVPEADFRENVRAICAWGRDRGIPVFYLTTTLHPEGHPAYPDRHPANYPVQSHYQRIVEEVAADCGAEIIPAAEALLAEAERTAPENIWIDWVHLNKLGNEIVAREVARALSDLPVLSGGG